MGKTYRTMRINAKGKVRDGRITMELPLPMAEVMMGMTGVVEELSREAGLMLISAMLDSECERIAGKKHSRNRQRNANWWGSEAGSVCFDGQKAHTERPRLRNTKGGELPLSTTNPIASCSSVTRSITGRVKRWRAGDMVQGWAVAALLRAESRFGRVRGYRLLVVMQQKSIDKKEMAA